MLLYESEQFLPLLYLYVTWNSCDKSNTVFFLEIFGLWNFLGSIHMIRLSHSGVSMGEAPPNVYPILLILSPCNGCPPSPLDTHLAHPPYILVFFPLHLGEPLPSLVCHFSRSFFMVQVSAPYNRILSTEARKNASLVTLEILDFHIMIPLHYLWAESNNRIRGQFEYNVTGFFASISFVNMHGAFVVP